MDTTQPQAAPVPNDRPAVQDLVIDDLYTRATAWTFVPRKTFDLVIADIEERKKLGLAKYGTLLQAFNGRDALVDAYQEAIDLVQYLRQALEEGQPMMTYYHTALQIALDLRRILEARV